MSIAFSRSIRALKADGFYDSTLGLLLSAILLSLWGAWFFLSRIALYEVSDKARLEVNRGVYPIEAPLTGRVVASHLVLSQEVHAGDVLVELESDAQRLQQKEERARIATLSAQLNVLRREVRAKEQARREYRQEARIMQEQARARLWEAQADLGFAQKQVERLALLQAEGAFAELDFLKAKAEAQKRRAALEANRLEFNRLKSNLQTKESNQQEQLERLQRDIALLEGQMATRAATIQRLEQELKKYYIWAPVAGQLGEVAHLRNGTVVRAGDKLGEVVPPGNLKVVADFLPSAALGRLRPKQPGRVRLEGFPWTQYGTVAATVTKVASEPQLGRVRVELNISSKPAFPISLQHGLPGTVEVEVEQVSPATLVLRAAGKLLATPRASLQTESTRGVD